MKRFFVRRAIYPIWLLLLAVYTIFFPSLIERIMKNHNEAIEKERKSKLTQL